MLHSLNLSPVLFQGAKSPQAKGKKTALRSRSSQETAVVAGSFDPPTIGHLDLIKRAAKKYKKVLVVIGNNTEKKGAFSIAERVAMFNAMFKEANITNAEVDVVTYHYIAKYAEKRGATVLIRGIRNEMDRDYEQTIATFNKQLAPDVRTVFLKPPKSIAHISSSLVKGLVGFVGWRELATPLVPAFVMDKLKTWYMQARFTKLTSELGIPAPIAQMEFTKLLQAYSDPRRSYHTKDHLLDCFERLDEMKETDPTLNPYGLRPKEPALLEMAIWFHDIVDEWTVKNPEAVPQSAEKARNFMQFARGRYGTEAIRNKVYDLVMATHYGKAPRPPQGYAGNLDAQLIQDIDLHAMGETPEKFDDNFNQVWAEYKHQYSDVDFLKGRQAFLQNWLGPSPMYHTPWFKERYEAQARKNMTDSVSTIQKLLAKAQTVKTAS